MPNNWQSWSTIMTTVRRGGISCTICSRTLRLLSSSADESAVEVFRWLHWSCIAKATHSKTLRNPIPIGTLWYHQPRCLHRQSNPWYRKWWLSMGWHLWTICLDPKSSATVSGSQTRINNSTSHNRNVGTHDIPDILRSYPWSLC